MQLIAEFHSPNVIRHGLVPRKRFCYEVCYWVMVWGGDMEEAFGKTKCEEASGSASLSWAAQGWNVHIDPCIRTLGRSNGKASSAQQPHHRLPPDHGPQ